MPLKQRGKPRKELKQKLLPFLFSFVLLFSSIEPWSVSKRDPIIKDNIESKNILKKDNYSSLIGYIFQSIIWFYQRYISPLGGGHCRYYITCSNYAKISFRKYGPIRGFFMSADRVMRCHQFQTESKDDPPDAWW